MAVDIVNNDKRVGLERGFAGDGTMLILIVSIILICMWGFSSDDGVFSKRTRNQRPNAFLVLMRNVYGFHIVGGLAIVIAAALYTTSRTLIYHKQEGVLIYSSTVFFSTYKKRWKRDDLVKLVAVRQQERIMGQGGTSTSEKGYLRAQRVD